MTADSGGQFYKEHFTRKLLQRSFLAFWFSTYQRSIFLPTSKLLWDLPKISNWQPMLKGHPQHVAAFALPTSGSLTWCILRKLATAPLSAGIFTHCWTMLRQLAQRHWANWHFTNDRCVDWIDHFGDLGNYLVSTIGSPGLVAMWGDS